MACPRCGATMCSIAFITEPKVIHAILRHLAAAGADQGGSPGSTTFAPTSLCHMDPQATTIGLNAIVEWVHPRIH